VLSSPFKRAVDTVAEFAQERGFEVELVEDFREHKICNVWIEDYKSFAEKQWGDFAYKLSDGECLAEVQGRNINALSMALNKYKDKNIAIGTHGVAISTIIKYYDSTYGFDDFMAMIELNPWIVKMDFIGTDCVGMKKSDIFNQRQKPDYSSSIVNTTWLGELKAYRYVVIFSRYKDKWLYCRTKDTGLWGTAGGRIEPGESPLDAAKRELYEETGAIKYDITPAFDYSVHIPSEYSNGQVFFAQIHELGDMPEYEMAEVGLFDTYPEDLRFSQILPILYDNMQVWLNLWSTK
jgi:2,3-bisphosphoglycerate-dependent phosphoglycerate mutase